MLGSCARTFVGNASVRKNFILGDFFVVEPDSTVEFDNDMRLKEDYDFTCSHISKYGSVMRCNRMTLNVKHYSNSGGACSNRDSKGGEEMRNIDILHRKWPGCFRKHPKRKNEVILSWKAAARSHGEDDEDAEETSQEEVVSGKRVSKSGAKSVKKTIVKKAHFFGSLSPKAILLRTDKRAKSSYIAARCGKANGKTVEQAVAKLTFQGDDGACHTYALSDLRYDLKCGYLSLKKGNKK